MPDYGTVYRDVQGRIMSIVNSQNASIPVPACPGWTVWLRTSMIFARRSGNLGTAHITW